MEGNSGEGCGCLPVAGALERSSSNTESAQSVPRRQPIPLSTSVELRHNPHNSMVPVRAGLFDVHSVELIRHTLGVGVSVGEKAE